MKTLKKIALKLLKKINKSRLQGIFENLYLFSLHGMGFGECELWDDGEEDILKNLNKKNKGKNKLIIFDVGANVGLYSSACKRLVKNIKIYAFEPSQKTFEILKNNLKNSNINLNNIGLGEKKKNETLFYDNYGTGLASIYDRKLDYRDIYLTKKENIKIETIDNFCKKNSIKKIDLLKIDVEGNELRVLQGAENMLKNKRIKRIQFEFGGCNIDSRAFFKDFWYMLHQDYYFYRILDFGGIVPIKNYSESREIFTTINYFLELK